MPANSSITAKSRQPRIRIPRHCGRWLLLGCATWTIFTVVRSKILLANARDIELHNSSFKRDYWLGNPASPPLTYLVLGDSTAAGWGAETVAETYPFQVAIALTKRGYYVHVINAAKGGATLGDMQKNQLPLLEIARPNLVTISIGANDTTHFTPPADYFRKVKMVIARLQQSSAQTISFANVPDMYRAPALPLPFSLATNLYARRFNGLFQKSLANSRVHEVDLFNRGKLDYHRNPQLYARDLFHPSGEGYKIWAQLFIEKLGESRF